MEDWPGTEAYCQMICDQVGVPLYVCRGQYFAVLCEVCERRHITNNPNLAWCHTCGAHDHQSISHQLTGIHSMIEWRGRFPDLQNRLCTSMWKRDAFHTWARANQDLLGDAPVLIMGERWAESQTRAKLLPVEPRILIRPGYLVVYHNILALSRREVFCDIRDAGLPLNPIYDLLWRTMLQIEHEDWRSGARSPHSSYPDQWNGLYDLEALPESLLSSMIEHLKYDVQEESHAPRYSCRDCFLLSSLLHRAAYRVEQQLGIVLPAHEDAVRIEAATGHRMTRDAALSKMLLPPVPQVDLWSQTW